MIFTTIYRVYFYHNEYEQMLKFRETIPEYRKVSEDTIGTLLEYRTDVQIDTGTSEHSVEMSPSDI